MKLRPVLAVVLALLLGVAATSCGSSDDTPQGSPLVQTLQKRGFSYESATCIEKAGKKADLTTKQIEALARGNATEVSPEARTAYATVLGECIGLDQSNTIKPTP